MLSYSLTFGANTKSKNPKILKTSNGKIVPL